MKIFISILLIFLLTECNNHDRIKNSIQLTDTINETKPICGSLNDSVFSNIKYHLSNSNKLKLIYTYTGIVEGNDHIDTAEIIIYTKETVIGSTINKELINQIIDSFPTIQILSKDSVHWYKTINDYKLYFMNNNDTINKIWWFPIYNKRTGYGQVCINGNWFKTDLNKLLQNLEIIKNNR